MMVVQLAGSVQSFASNDLPAVPRQVKSCEPSACVLPGVQLSRPLLLISTDKVLPVGNVILAPPIFASLFWQNGTTFIGTFLGAVQAPSWSGKVWQLNAISALFQHL